MADLEHASENDSDLHGDPDAAHWAERFATMFEVRRLADIGNRGIHEPVDTEGLMLTWFAAAIETGKMAARPPLRHGVRHWAELSLNGSWHAQCFCGWELINLDKESADAALQQHIASKLWGHISGATMHTVRAWGHLRPDRRDWAAQCSCSVTRAGFRLETANAALRRHFEEENDHA